MASIQALLKGDGFGWDWDSDSGLDSGKPGGLATKSNSFGGVFINNVTKPGVLERSVSAISKIKRKNPSGVADNNGHTQSNTMNVMKGGRSPNCTGAVSNSYIATSCRTRLLFLHVNCIEGAWGPERYMNKARWLHAVHAWFVPHLHHHLDHQLHHQLDHR
jgi:hypothetical protein